jgi:ATP-dependent DNA ligase
LAIRNIIPMTLAQLPAPFEHTDWLFDVKYDGFRASA